MSAQQLRASKMAPNFLFHDSTSGMHKMRENHFAEYWEVVVLFILMRLDAMTFIACYFVSFVIKSVLGILW